MDAAAPAGSPGRSRHGVILAAIVLAGSLILAYTRLPGPACYFRLLLHVPCPGCGLTRSLESLWHGHPLTSFRYHPLGIPIFAICVAAVVHGVRHGANRPFRIPGMSLRNVFLLFAAVWLIRLAFALSGSRFFLW